MIWYFIKLTLIMVSSLVFSPSFTSKAYWRRNIFLNWNIFTIFFCKFTNNQYLVLWIKAERGSGFSCLSRIFSSSSDSSPSLSNLELAMLKYTKHSIWQTHKNSATSLDILCLFLVAIVPLSCKVFFATVTFFSETNHFFT